MNENGHCFTVEATCPPLRLDRFLAQQMQGEDMSREKIKKAVQAGGCTVDGLVCRDPSRRLNAGETVRLCLPNPNRTVTPEQGELRVLYEDSHLAILDKPAGLTVHPCPSCPEGTLVHRLLARFPCLAAQGGERPGIVHRLDKDTSGLLVAALTETARLRLAEAFAARTVHKEYLALVHGVPASSGTMDVPLGRDPGSKIKMAPLVGGRPALSEWRVLYADDRSRFAVLAVRIRTGRTHQIRVHMAHAGFPLCGDTLYGGTQQAGFCSRQMLHARRLSFVHPTDGRTLSFVCPPPEDFWNAVSGLDRRMQRVVITGMPGCGKSTLLQALSDRGVPVWSADAAVIRLYEAGGAGWDMLRRRYGDRFVPKARGPVDRRALAAALAEDGDLKKEVENVIHPLVREELETFWRKQEAEGHARAAAEVPLWFECGWKSARGYEPVVVGLRCHPDRRYARLETSRNWSPDKTAVVDAWQWEESRKLKGCALIVDNDGAQIGLTEAAGSLIRDLDDLEQKRRKGIDVLRETVLQDAPFIHDAHE